MRKIGLMDKEFASVMNALDKNKLYKSLTVKERTYLLSEIMTREVLFRQIWRETNEGVKFWKFLDNYIRKFRRKLIKNV